MPDIKNNDMKPQRIDADKHQTFNGMEVSLGVAPILQTLYQLSTRPGRVMWTLYLINMETIIRDRGRDTLSAYAPKDQMVDNVLTDCTVLAQYIASYCRYVLPRTMKIRPLVCFYLPHYENIPHLYLRKRLPKGTEDRWEIRDLIEERLHQEPFPVQFEETEILFSVLNQKGKQCWPHRELLVDLCENHDDLQYRQVLMVSHVPLDFHLYRSFKYFRVLESYTGALKNPTDFGKKVFNSADIPFNKYTHLALGDKWYLDSQLKTTAKRSLKEMATRQRWNLLPDKTVAENIIKAGLLLPDVILKPNI